MRTINWSELQLENHYHLDKENRYFYIEQKLVPGSTDIATEQIVNKSLQLDSTLKAPEVSEEEYFNHLNELALERKKDLAEARERYQEFKKEEQERIDKVSEALAKSLKISKEDALLLVPFRAFDNGYPDKVSWKF